MTNDNARISQAVLKKVVENNTEALKRIDTRLEKIDVCISDFERRLSVVETKQDHTEKDIEGLSRKTDGWNAINSIGAGIAGILAWFK